MAAPAHGHQQVSLAGDSDGGADIGDAGTPGDEPGTTIDRAVPHLAMLVIASSTRTDELTPKRCLQLIDGSSLDHRVLSHWYSLDLLALHRADSHTWERPEKGDCHRLVPNFMERAAHTSGAIYAQQHGHRRMGHRSHGGEEWFSWIVNCSPSSTRAAPTGSRRPLTGSCGRRPECPRRTRGARHGAGGPGCDAARAAATALRAGVDRRDSRRASPRCQPRWTLTGHRAVHSAACRIVELSLGRHSASYRSGAGSAST